MKSTFSQLVKFLVGKFCQVLNLKCNIRTKYDPKCCFQLPYSRGISRRYFGGHNPSRRKFSLIFYDFLTINSQSLFLIFFKIILKHVIWVIKIPNWYFYMSKRPFLLKIPKISQIKTSQGIFHMTRRRNFLIVKYT